MSGQMGYCIGKGRNAMVWWRKREVENDSGMAIGFFGLPRKRKTVLRVVEWHPLRDYWMCGRGLRIFEHEA